MNNYEIANKFKSGLLTKPEAKMIGMDGNVFNLIGIARKSLKSMPAAYNEMWERIQKCSSYDEALCIMMEYVDIT